MNPEDLTLRGENAKNLPSSSRRFISLILGLLMMLGVGVFAYLNQSSVIDSRDWVVHTYSVREELDNLQLQLSTARAATSAYVLTHDQNQLLHFQTAASVIPGILTTLRGLTQDNSCQQARLDRLEPLLQAQMARAENLSAETGVHNPEASKSEQANAKAFTRSELEMDAIIRSMYDEGELLLRTRLQEWKRLFKRNVIALAAVFGLAFLVLVYDFRLLLDEVRVTKDLETRERKTAESYRSLSARILELQDTERRRIARELHDSVGQYLAGLKINLGHIQAGASERRPDGQRLIIETMDMTDRALGEVRTISHLLHPPLLDELGLEAAMQWYVEEFGKRSGMQVQLETEAITERLPRDVEMALFRVLQESLTNVHRHAHAKSVRIRATCGDGKVILTIADDGNGIPKEPLVRFRSGLAGGIGLAGMRERLAELGGKLDVQSNGEGSLVRATLPTNACDSAAHPADAPRPPVN